LIVDTAKTEAKALEIEESVSIKINKLPSTAKGCLFSIEKDLMSFNEN